MTCKTNIFLRWFFMCLVMLLGINCYPVDKLNVDTEPELKDEIRYPNGTVVGKYTYMDNEGNPIHVKYYADDASYGVELKSVKVIDISTTEEPTWQSNFDPLKPIESPLGMSPEFLTPNKKKTDKKKDTKKVNPYKVGKIPDYETFYQNEIKSPRQCEKGNDKVRVYLDKEKRIIRRALDNYQVAKYCDRL